MMSQSASPTYGSSTAANGIRNGSESKSFKEEDPFIGHFSREQTCLSFDVKDKPESEQETSVALISTRTI